MISADEIRQKLINRFVTEGPGKCSAIMAGISTGDIELAHRLAHTLKSNAGQLELAALQEAAATVEHHLKDGVNLVTPGQAAALQTELEAAMRKLAPLYSEPVRPAQAELLGSAAALELLAKIEPLLEEYDTACMTFTDSLRLIPGSETLIRQIEDFAFEEALATVRQFKKLL